MPAAPRWLLLYDDDCGFCRTLLAGLLGWDRRGRLRPLPLLDAEAEELLADLAPDARLESWRLVSPAGGRWSGGAALPPLLRLLPGGRAPAAVLSRFPRSTERGYRWVAAHRSQLSRLVPARLARRAERFLTVSSGAVRPERGAAPRAR